MAYRDEQGRFHATEEQVKRWGEGRKLKQEWGKKVEKRTRFFESLSKKLKEALLNDNIALAQELNVECKKVCGEDLGPRPM